MTPTERAGRVFPGKGGESCKRKLNNEDDDGEVQEIRGRTVRLKSSTGNSAIGQCSKADPLTMLSSDEIILKILSYAYTKCPLEEDEKAQTLWLRKMASQTGTMWLSQVSSLWNHAIQRVLPDLIGTVAVDFYQSEPWVPHLFQWISNHPGIKLSSVKFRFAQLGDVPHITKFIQACRTEDLHDLELSLNKQRVPLSHVSEYYLKEKVDWDALVDAREQKTVHNLIAQECPNISSLKVAITLPVQSADYTDFISPALFSMPTIEKLSVSFGYFEVDPSYQPRDDWVPIDSNIITTLVRNLPALTHLKLASACERVGSYRRYHVVCPTLKHLDVTRLGKLFFVSCDCPGLTTFRCNGHTYGNGTRPRLTRSQFRHIQEFLVPGEYQGWDNLVIRAGSAEFPYCTMPDTCEVTLEQFGGKCYNGYYGYCTDYVGEVEEAQFQTFPATP